jgi:hypothetical protein
MASETQILANRPNEQESDSPRTAPMEKSTVNTGAPGDYFMQNKPNSLKAQINANSLVIKDYENRWQWRVGKSKANQTQFQNPTPKEREEKKVSGKQSQIDIKWPKFSILTRERLPIFYCFSAHLLLKL